MSDLVVAERGQQQTVSGESRQLHGRDRATSADLLPRLERVDDLALGGQLRDSGELGPFDVADDGHGRRAIRSRGGGQTGVTGAPSRAQSSSSGITIRLSRSCVKPAQTQLTTAFERSSPVESSARWTAPQARNAALPFIVRP